MPMTEDQVPQELMDDIYYASKLVGWYESAADEAYERLEAAIQNGEIEESIFLANFMAHCETIIDFFARQYY